MRYFAVSASEKTNDWPFWFVADKEKGGLNVSAELTRKFVDISHKGHVLMTKNSAILLAELANSETKDPNAELWFLY